MAESINTRVSLILACFTFIVWSISECSSVSTYTILEKDTKRTWDDAVTQCARVPGRHIALLDTTEEKDLLRQAAMGVGATLGWYWMREAGVSDCSTMNLDNQRWKSHQCTRLWFYICEQEGTSPASPPTTAVLPSSAATPSGSPDVQTATSTSPASPPTTDVLPSSALVTPPGSPHVQTTTTTTTTTSEQDLLMCSNNSSVCYRGYSTSYTISSASPGHHMMKSSDYSMVSADDATHDRFVLKTIKGCRSRLRCATACLKESSCTWFVYLGNKDCLLSGESAIVN